MREETEDVLTEFVSQYLQTKVQFYDVGYGHLIFGAWAGFKVKPQDLDMKSPFIYIVVADPVHLDEEVTIANIRTNVSINIKDVLTIPLHELANISRKHWTTETQAVLDKISSLDVVDTDTKLMESKSSIEFTAARIIRVYDKWMNINIYELTEMWNAMGQLDNDDPTWQLTVSLT